jgi:hypothetical protein
MRALGVPQWLPDCATRKHRRHTAVNERSQLAFAIAYSGAGARPETAPFWHTLPSLWLRPTRYARSGMGRLPNICTE